MYLSDPFFWIPKPLTSSAQSPAGLQPRDGRGRPGRDGRSGGRAWHSGAGAWGLGLLGLRVWGLSFWFWASGSDATGREDQNPNNRELQTYNAVQSLPTNEYCGVTPEDVKSWYQGSPAFMPMPSLIAHTPYAPFHRNSMPTFRGPRRIQAVRPNLGALQLNSVTSVCRGRTHNGHTGPCSSSSCSPSCCSSRCLSCTGGCHAPPRSMHRRCISRGSHRSDHGRGPPLPCPTPGDPRSFSCTRKFLLRKNCSPWDGGSASC